MEDSKNCARFAVGILLRCARFGTRLYLHSWQNVHKEPRDIGKQSSDKICGPTELSMAAYVSLLLL